MKLRGKMILSILGVVVVLFSAIISYIILSSTRQARQDAEALAMENVMAMGANVEAQLNYELSVLTTIGNIIAKMDRTAPGARERVLNIIETGASLSKNTANMWIGFEPNAFDGRDAEYTGEELYGKSGQLAASFMDNGDGTARRDQGFNASLFYLPEEYHWYKKPLTTGEVTLAEPEMYNFTDGSQAIVSSLCFPLRIGGELVGVIGTDISYKSIQEELAQTKLISKNAVALLIGNGGTIAYSTIPSYILSNISELLKDQADAADAANVVNAVRSGQKHQIYDRIVSTGERALKAYTPVKVGDSKQYLSMNVNVPVKDIMGGVSTIRRNAIILATAGIVFLSLVIAWLIGRVIRPIQLISGLMERAAQLNFVTDNSKIVLLKHRDEIGAMAKAYMNLQISLTRIFHRLNDEAVKSSTSAQTLAAISQESVASLQEVKSSVDEVAHLSETNACNLEETNASVDEVSHTTASTASAAEEGAVAATKTSDLTRNAVDEVSGVVNHIREAGTRSLQSGESIDKVGASVSAITGFVTTITGIADQTNLLALNAAIEAARAGDAGRGFAVVAEEVRHLAEESGNAAQEVQKLISTLQEDTQNASAIITEMGDILQKTVLEAEKAGEDLGRSLLEVNSLSAAMQSIAAEAQQQAAASGEMATAVARASQATAEVKENLDGIKAAASDTSIAGENVAQEAQRLSEGAERLHGIIEMFMYDDPRTNEMNAARLGITDGALSAQAS